MNKPLVLLADDEVRLRKLVSDFLVSAGFEVICAENGKEAFDFFLKKSESIDLIILDVMMPLMDGWEVLSEIKNISTVPVIMLTAKGEESDQLTGFRLGANDYVCKPFSPSVLVARVENLLKQMKKMKQDKLNIGGIEVDIHQHAVYVDENSIGLTPKEFDLLLYLFKNKNLALSRDKILNGVWSYDYHGDLRTVDTHIKQLRGKLGDYGHFIETIRGVGYRLREQK
ncbi:response regulator transcription factor [Fictibacillus sp. 7GRE50]|jgi:two-component system, OmpR family, response regulator ResD|uniref:response regulator transcription factor n=1 Tax=Fictibacillus sp. 7GRE50 TaxID=2745878 RepID=UPI0018CD3731|nr:response regulator transcription factor [Fictibacillus sp. 7GRE50]MBH0166690.1 response regulator transcription factor [Fictibacillus sp. 7GRE50]